MRGVRSFEGRGGLVLIKRERGWREGGGGGQLVHVSNKSFQWDKSDGFGKKKKKHQSIKGGGVGRGRNGWGSLIRAWKLYISERGYM